MVTVVAGRAVVQPAPLPVNFGSTRDRLAGSLHISIIPNLIFGFSGRVLTTLGDEDTTEVKMADTTTMMAINQNELNTFVQVGSCTVAP